MLKYLKKNISTIQLFTFCLPAVIVIFVFNYLPMAGLVLAFKDYKPKLGFFGSEWVGFENFEFFFTSQDAWNVTRNTLVLNFVGIIATSCITVFLSLVLYEISNRALLKTYQTIIFFPYFLSWVVVSYAAYAFLSEEYGIINSILNSLGMETITWYSESKYWPFILIFANVWKNIGYGTLIYYSTLLSIDKGYFEAAEIDGANKLQMIRYISIPFIMPIVLVLFLLSVGRIFYSDFGLYYYLPMNSGALYPVTDVIDTYIYRALRVVGNMSMSSAVNFYQSVMGLIVIVSANFIVRKVNSEGALF